MNVGVIDGKAICVFILCSDLAQTPDNEILASLTLLVDFADIADTKFEALDSIGIHGSMVAVIVMHLVAKLGASE